MTTPFAERCEFTGCSELSLEYRGHPRCRACGRPVCALHQTPDTVLSESTGCTCLCSTCEWVSGR